MYYFINISYKALGMEEAEEMLADRSDMRASVERTVVG